MIYGCPKVDRVGLTKTVLIMKNKSKHQSDIKNANKGQDGTNTTYDRNQGNRGKQLNPNKKVKK